MGQTERRVKTERIVREVDGRVNPTEETVMKLSREKRCIIFPVLGAGGTIMPVRVRTNKNAVLTEAGILLRDTWLPDCREAAKEELDDECTVKYDPDSTKKIKVDGKEYIEMGTIEFNLDAVPKFVAPRPRPVARR